MINKVNKKVIKIILIVQSILIFDACNNFVDVKCCKQLYSNSNSRIIDINQTFNNVLYELKYELETKLDNNRIADVSTLNEMIDTLNYRVNKSISDLAKLNECDESIKLRNGAIDYFNNVALLSKDISILIKYLEKGFTEQQRDTLCKLLLKIFKTGVETTHSYDKLAKEYSEKYNLEYNFPKFDYNKQMNRIKNYEKNN